MVSTSFVERLPASLPNAWSIPKPVLSERTSRHKVAPGNKCEVGEPGGIVARF